jgi:hypothetical protein
MLVYPNPTATILSYSLPLSESKTTVQIIDLKGTLIREKQFQFINTENSLQSLNIADLKSGVYFLKIKNFNGNEESIRFIKE